MDLSLSSTDRIHIKSREERLVIEVRGVLDAVAVKAVEAIVSAADGSRAIEIDLSALAAHTDAGAERLARLVRHDHALAYRASSDEGQLALLAIYRSYPVE